MLKRLLPHFLVVGSMFFLTLLIIDQVNSAMGFITSQITKILMIIFFVLVLVTMGILIHDQRKEGNSSGRRSRQRHSRSIRPPQ